MPVKHFFNGLLARVSYFDIMALFVPQAVEELRVVKTPRRIERLSSRKALE